MGWKTTASAVVSGMIAFITYVFPVEVGDFFNSIFPNAGYYIVRAVFAIAFGYIVILGVYEGYKRMKAKSPPELLSQQVHEIVPVSPSAEKLKALSPIHVMITAIGRASPIEASFGRAAGVEIGRFVHLDDVPNLDEVRLAFSKHCAILGDYHLGKWLDFEAQIKEYRSKGGFWVGAREWNWFFELETEYYDARRLSVPQAADVSSDLTGLEVTVAETKLADHEKVKEIEVELDDGHVIRHNARFYYVTLKNTGKKPVVISASYKSAERMIFVPLNEKSRFRVKCSLNIEGFERKVRDFQSREEAFGVALLNDERWTMRDQVIVYPNHPGETFVLFFAMEGFRVLTIPGVSRIYPNHREGIPCTITLPICLTGSISGHYVARFKVNVKSWQDFPVEQIGQIKWYPAAQSSGGYDE